MFFTVLIITFFMSSKAINVPGVSLESNTSAVCAEALLEHINNFLLCSFIHLKNETTNLEQINTVFELSDARSSFELMYGYQGNFIINYREQIFVYPKLIKFGDWTKLCVNVTRGKVDLEVNYRSTRKLENYEEFDDEDLFRRSKKESEGNSMESFNIKLNQRTVTKSLNSRTSSRDAKSSGFLICAGNFRKGSIIGSIAGTTLRQCTKARSTVVKETCRVEMLNETSASFARNSTQKYGSIKYLQYVHQELCWATHVVLLLQNFASYEDHFKRCQNLSGRLVLREEVALFLEKLKDIYSRKLNCSQLNAKNDRCSTWVQSDVICTAFSLSERKLSKLECMAELEFSLCMIPKYTDIFYFGNLRNFDHFYTLESRDNIIFLRGNKRSWIEMENSSWFLRSKIHTEQLTLQNVTHPIGRHRWKSLNQEKEFILAFTHCDTGINFTCSNGACVPNEARCNGLFECSDQSDEENCSVIYKVKEYSIDDVPKDELNEEAPANQRIFTLFYDVGIQGISDISSHDGIAQIELNIIFFWSDPRILYKNPTNKIINCDEIWTPTLKVEDDAGTRIQHKARDSECLIAEISFKNNADTSNPFMDRSFEGKDVKLQLTTKLSVTVPCQFDNREFPFGFQNCSIAIDLKMKENGVLEMKSLTSKNQLKYESKKQYLGDYFFIGATHNVRRTKSNLDNVTSTARPLVLTFQLKHFYSSYVLNCFIPSILSCLVSYSSFFFSIYCVIGRIMISLISLLMLVALSVQASITSVKTSYFKYIDIWFGSLMIYCCCVVGANLLVHTLECLDNKTIGHFGFNTLKECDTKDQNKSADEQTYSKMAHVINQIFIIIFPIIFVVFLVIFSLGVAHII